MRWNAAADAQTPAAGLSYNLAVGTTPGGTNIVSPQANRASGWRRLPALGNAPSGTNATLELPLGTYYWAVQAVDGAWAGGPFSTNGTFQVTSTVVVRIVAWERRGANQFWLRFTGVPGVAHRVEWSDNLTMWTNLGTATETMTPGVYEYLDTLATPARRFHRIVTP